MAAIGKGKDSAPAWTSINFIISQMAAVWALGINHTTAPLDLRGRFAFAVDQMAPTLHGLRESFGTQRHPDVEAAIIST